MNNQKEKDIIKKKKSEFEEEIELADFEEEKKEEAVAAAEEEAGAENKDYEKLSEEYLDGWKRCQADFENYKKQQSASQKEFSKFANRDLIMRILPVIDNFHASTDHIPEEQKNNPWVVGIMHIQKQLEQVVKDSGVEEVEIKEGDEFDPALHEAISNNQEPRNNDQREKEAKNKITKVLNKGYRTGDRIIRPAKVIVG